MSHHGEESSSTTLPSQTTSEAVNLQREVVDKCLDIVQQFRGDKVTKSRATILLQQAIPHETLEEASFVSAYESYLEMLDNFESYQRGAARRIAETGELLGAEQPGPGEPREGECLEQRDTLAVGPSKRARSPEGSDNDDDEYKRRVRLDYRALPWTDSDATFITTSELSPSLQKTQALLENFSRDVKRARSSLLNSNRAIPQFPQSEWLSLLSGNSIDLDHVFSNLYTISHDDRESIELGKHVELLHGTSAPAKTVKTHGDWVIAWEAAVEATLFVFKHRQQELSLYGKHIQRFFASLPDQFHTRVINYDRAVCIRVAQRRDLELSNFTEFTDLQIQWIHIPASSSTPKSDSKPPKPPKGKRTTACRRWNDRKCPNDAATCNYLHICAKCSDSAHVAADCPGLSKK